MLTIPPSGMSKQRALLTTVLMPSTIGCLHLLHGGTKRFHQEVPRNNHQRHHSQDQENWLALTSTLAVGDFDGFQILANSKKKHESCHHSCVGSWRPWPLSVVLGHQFKRRSRMRICLNSASEEVAPTHPAKTWRNVEQRMGSAAVHCSFLIFGNPVESKPVLGTRPPLEVDMLRHRLTFQATRQFEQVYFVVHFTLPHNFFKPEFWFGSFWASMRQRTSRPPVHSNSWVEESAIPWDHGWRLTVGDWQQKQWLLSQKIILKGVCEHDACLWRQDWTWLNTNFVRPKSNFILQYQNQTKWRSSSNIVFLCFLESIFTQ